MAVILFIANAYVTGAIRGRNFNMKRMEIFAMEVFLFFTFVLVFQIELEFFYDYLEDKKDPLSTTSFFFEGDEDQLFHFSRFFAFLFNYASILRTVDEIGAKNIRRTIARKRKDLVDTIKLRRATYAKEFGNPNPYPDLRPSKSVLQKNEIWKRERRAWLLEVAEYHKDKAQRHKEEVEELSKSDSLWARIRLRMIDPKVQTPEEAYEESVLGAMVTNGEEVEWWFIKTFAIPCYNFFMKVKAFLLFPYTWVRSRFGKQTGETKPDGSEADQDPETSLTLMEEAEAEAAPHWNSSKKKPRRWHSAERFVKFYPIFLPRERAHAVWLISGKLDSFDIELIQDYAMERLLRRDFLQRVLNRPRHMMMLPLEMDPVIRREDAVNAGLEEINMKFTKHRYTQMSFQAQNDYVRRAEIWTPTPNQPNACLCMAPIHEDPLDYRVETLPTYAEVEQRLEEQGIHSKMDVEALDEFADYVIPEEPYPSLTPNWKRIYINTKGNKPDYSYEETVKQCLAAGRPDDSVKFEVIDDEETGMPEIRDVPEYRGKRPTRYFRLEPSGAGDGSIKWVLHQGLLPNPSIKGLWPDLPESDATETAQDAADANPSTSYSDIEEEILASVTAAAVPATTRPTVHAARPATYSDTDDEVPAATAAAAEPTRTKSRARPKVWPRTTTDSDSEDETMAVTAAAAEPPTARRRAIPRRAAKQASARPTTEPDIEYEVPAATAAAAEVPSAAPVEKMHHQARPANFFMEDEDEWGPDVGNLGMSCRFGAAQRIARPPPSFEDEKEPETVYGRNPVRRGRDEADDPLAADDEEDLSDRMNRSRQRHYQMDTVYEGEDIPGDWKNTLRGTTSSLLLLPQELEYEDQSVPKGDREAEKNHRAYRNFCQVMFNPNSVKAVGYPYEEFNQFEDEEVEARIHIEAQKRKIGADGMYYRKKDQTGVEEPGDQEPEPHFKGSHEQIVLDPRTNTLRIVKTSEVNPDDETFRSFDPATDNHGTGLETLPNVGLYEVCHWGRARNPFSDQMEDFLIPNDPKYKRLFEIRRPGKKLPKTFAELRDEAQPRYHYRL